MKLPIILIKFLFIGALFIVSNNGLYLSHPEDMATFTNMYSSWMNNLFDNAKHITAYAVKSEWLPGNNNSLLSGVSLAMQLSFYIPIF